MKTIKIISIFGLVVFSVCYVFYVYLDLTQQDDFLQKTKMVFQSPEQRFGCENGKIENVIESDLIKTKNQFKVMNGISTNIVEYPLNKKEIMMEYCFRVANLTSEIGGLWLTVKLLDKNKNVLIESEERVANIPGKRIKTVYGSVFVPIALAEEITNILVGE